MVMHSDCLVLSLILLTNNNCKCCFSEMFGYVNLEKCKTIIQKCFLFIKTTIIIKCIECLQNINKIHRQLLC